MPSVLRNRRFWIGVVFVATVGAALWPLPDEGARPPAPVGKAAPGVEAAPRKAAKKPVTASAAIFAPLAAASTAPVLEPAKDLFPVLTWTPPPPPPPPVAPTAPPLPFVYGGRYTEGASVWVFLLENDQIHKLRAGDTLRGTYRIDKIEPAAITMTYLPLQTPQRLQTGSPTP